MSAGTPSRRREERKQLLATGNVPDRYVVGCMTGTSIDGLDAALLHVQGAGLTMQAQFIRGHTRELGQLAPVLRALADQRPMTARAIATCAHDFTDLHARTIAELLIEARAGREIPVRAAPDPDLICVHGQTVYHAPPISWQLFEPAALARTFQSPVVCNLRSADLAGGGQGAPITPIADVVLFGREGQDVCVVNLGGFVNVTYVPGITGREGTPRSMRHAQAEGVLAGDVCACNQVLDAVARQLLGAPFDADGRAASTGAPNAQATSRLRELLAGQATQRRSLGTGDEVGSWIGEFGRSVSPGAMAASACDAIASVVMTHLHGLTATAQTCDVLLAGGGVHNLALRHALATRHGGRVRTTDDVGVPAQYREAACFGVLGVLSADGVPITLPQVTGAVKPGRAGVWVFP